MKPDGVGDEHGLAARELQAAGRGVEGGEEPVLDEHAGVGQLVEQRRLAGVRVADDGDVGEAAAVPRLALGVAVAGDLAAGRASSRVMRRWMRRRSTSSWVSPGPRVPMRAPPRRHAARLLRERLAPAPEPRQPVPQQRQLDLRLALLAGGVLGEDVEDHRGAVDGGAPEQLLEVELLGRRELVVEDDRVAVDLEGDLAQLLGLALADVVRRVGRVAPLHDPGDLVGAGGVDELRQLVERRVDVVERLVAEGDADEDDLLAEGALDELGRGGMRLGSQSGPGVVDRTDKRDRRRHADLRAAEIDLGRRRRPSRTVTRSPASPQRLAAAAAAHGAGAAGEGEADAPLVHVHR